MMGKSALTPISHDVHLCYGRHSGYGGYSTPQLHLRGARVMQIDFVNRTINNSVAVEASSSSEPLSSSSVPSNAQGVALSISAAEASELDPMSKQEILAKAKAAADAKRRAIEANKQATLEQASIASEPLSSSSSAPLNYTEPSQPMVSSWVRLETGFVEGVVNAEEPAFGA